MLTISDLPDLHLSSCPEFTQDTPLVLAPGLRTIRCDEDTIVIYNTLLNSPVILNREGYDQLDSLNGLTLAQINRREELTELAEILVASFHLMPEGLTGQQLLNVWNRRYLEQVAAGQTIQMLDLRLSEGCNFGCPHCIAHDAQKPRIMDFDTAREIVDAYVAFLKKHQPQAHKLSIHYGNCEPLMNYRVLEQIHRYCLAAYPEYELEASVNTNLSLMTEDMARFFRDQNIAVYTSLDGPKPGNDAIRMYRSGRGTYDTILEKMALMAREGYPIRGISVTLTDTNYRYFDDSFIQWCKDQDYLSVACDFDLIHSLTIPIEEQADFLVRTWCKFKELGIEFYGTWITPFLNFANATPAEKPSAFCKAVTGNNLSVDAQKNIYMCSYDGRRICSLNTLEESLAPGGAFYSFVEENLAGNLKGRCAGCVLEGACNGQCRITNAHSLDKQIQQCTFYRDVTEKMIRASLLTP